MSKESDLSALAAGVRDFTANEIPNEAAWDQNGIILHDALLLIGAGFTLTDADVAALVAKYNANHNPDGSHAPPAEWVADGSVPTFLAGDRFSLPGDRTAAFRKGDRLRLHQGVGGTTLVIVGVDAVTFSGAFNTTTLTVRTATTTAPVISTLVSIDRSLTRDSLPRQSGFDLADDAIDESRILKDGVVTLGKLATDSVDRTKIVNGEVVSAKLATDAVGTANLAAGAVTSAKIANGAVGNAKIADGAVTTGKIGAQQIVTAHIADLAITNDQMAANSVGTGNIADTSVTTAKLPDAAITTPKLADKAVTRQKRADIWTQSPAGNVQVAATEVQHGWGFVTVGTDGNRRFLKAVTFPVPFTSLVSLRVTPIGYKTTAGNPTSILDTDATLTNGDVGATQENMLLAMPQGGSVTLAGFVALLGLNMTSAPTTGNVQSGAKILFEWEARGTY